ncbi:hypothetical protein CAUPRSCDRAFT_11322 [Caulochytrium protostelioides]|uniref:Lipoyl-binding domain-containing protein n=1 Tax=Caulochytrium protostelioides TaxID=1555241 RepID=A0A4P9WXC6_9FUNG|nr:hypothetical protein CAUPRSCDRAFT_11322 [Caulochytrium protostelioides]
MISAGDVYCEIEVMKMILPLTAAIGGKLQILQNPGAIIRKGALLARVVMDDNENDNGGCQTTASRSSVVPFEGSWAFDAAANALREDGAAVDAADADAGAVGIDALLHDPPPRRQAPHARRHRHRHDGAAPRGGRHAAATSAGRERRRERRVARPQGIARRRGRRHRRPGPADPAAVPQTAALHASRDRRAGGGGGRPDAAVRGHRAPAAPPGPRAALVDRGRPVIGAGAGARARPRAERGPLRDRDLPAPGPERGRGRRAAAQQQRQRAPAGRLRRAPLCPPRDAARRAAAATDAAARRRPRPRAAGAAQRAAGGVRAIHGDLTGAVRAVGVVHGVVVVVALVVAVRGLCGVVG